MGKVLSGELSCPCDKSCLHFLDQKCPSDAKVLQSAKVLEHLKTLIFHLSQMENYCFSGVPIFFIKMISNYQDFYHDDYFLRCFLLFLEIFCVHS